MSDNKENVCDVRGFVVDTKSHKSPGNVSPEISGYKYQITESGYFDTGNFSMELSGLVPGTSYYYRACAHSRLGWVYGSEKVFQTKHKRGWKEIVSSLEIEGFEVGFPSGIKIKRNK